MQLSAEKGLLNFDVYMQKNQFPFPAIVHIRLITDYFISVKKHDAFLNIHNDISIEN